MFLPFYRIFGHWIASQGATLDWSDSLLFLKLEMHESIDQFKFHSMNALVFDDSISGLCHA